jgi:hypothetical protein
MPTFLVIKGKWNNIIQSVVGGEKEMSTKFLPQQYKTNESQNKNKNDFISIYLAYLHNKF